MSKGRRIETNPDVPPVFFSKQSLTRKRKQITRFGDVVHALIGLLADRLPADSFPAWPTDEKPLRDWLAKSVQATPTARHCLDNFAAIVWERRRAESSDDRVDNGRLFRIGASQAQRRPVAGRDFPC